MKADFTVPDGINLLPDATDRCPSCGNEDIQLWADDGEADLADWWECGCGAHGAVLDPADSDLTQNGIGLVLLEVKS